MLHFHYWPVVGSLGKGLAVTVYFGNMICKNNAESRMQKLCGKS